MSKSNRFIKALRLLIVLITVVAPLVSAPLKAEADTTGADFSLISQGTTASGLGLYYGTSPSVSDDGRYVAFLGAAEKPNGTSATTQIFLKDNVTGAIQIVSVSNNGELANQFVYNPVISRNGRYVVFASNSTNLVPNDTNGEEDIFVRDTVDGTTTRASVASDGTQANGASDVGTVSGDGRYVVFESAATDLVPNDTNGAYDIFMHDMQTGTTTRISINSNGGQTACSAIVQYCESPYSYLGQGINSVSYDGRYVLFQSVATNLTSIKESGPYAAEQVYLRDNLLGTTTLVSETYNGYQSNESEVPYSLTDDGRYVVFGGGSSAYNSDLTPDGDDGVGQLYLRDMVAGTTTKVSVNDSGVQSNKSAGNALITNDGTTVLFASASTNLTSDSVTGTSNNIFTRNLTTNTTSLVNTTTYTGASPNAGLQLFDMSSDGRYLALASTASNLTPDSTNGNSQVFLLDRFPVPSSPANLTAQSPAQNPALSWDNVTGATSYNIYRNGTKIDSSTTNSYTDSSAPEGTDSYYVTAVNSAGESPPSNTVTVLVDRTAPTIAYTLSPAPNINGWDQNDVTVTFSCSDALSGVATCSSPVTLSTEGASQTVTGTAKDNAGNSASVTATVNIDKTAPTISYALSPAPNANGWNNSDTTVSFNCSDSLSGIDSCTVPTTISTEGANQAVIGTAVDKAGNTSAAMATLNIDKTAPVVSSLSWSANPLQQGQNTTLLAAVSDSLSGISQVEYSINGGPPQPMTYDPISGDYIVTFGSDLAANTYNITVTATDNAGNTSAGTNDILAVYTTANGYVTGHAKLQPAASDTLPIALDTSKDPANLVLGFTNVMAPTSGSFDMDYSIKNNQNEFSLSSTGIDWVVVPDSSHASILGQADMTAYVNGVKSVTQNMSVRFDLTLGANGSPDQISIKIFNPGVNPNTGTPAYVISEPDINGSNLMIHP